MPFSNANRTFYTAKVTTGRTDGRTYSFLLYDDNSVKVSYTYLEKQFYNYYYNVENPAKEILNLVDFRAFEPHRFDSGFHAVLRIGLQVYRKTCDFNSVKVSYTYLEKQFYNYYYNVENPAKEILNLVDFRAFESHRLDS